MANTYLTRTTGTPTLGTKCTVSVWVKLGEVPNGGGSDRWIFGEYGNGSNHSYLYLRNSSEIGWYEADGSGAVASIITNRLCRDLSGWYHFMIAYDTTLATQADRFKLYINGERETSFSTNTNNISQNYLPRINKASRTYHIGGVNGVQTMFNGLMSHYHHCDGSALEPSVFGETDTATGEWKIKTSPSFTLGNNGFTILKDGMTITDQSSNSNNFTLAGGTLTKSEDNPSNNFATLNALNQTNSNATFSHGNNTLAVSGNWLGATSTIGVFKGKWYFEWLSDGNNHGAGICQIGKRMSRTTEISTGNNGYLGKYNDTWSFYNNGNSAYKLTNDTTTSYGSDLVNGDIGMFALDADNGKIWAGKNGTWFESGDPANGTNAMYDSLDNSFGWLVGVFGENSTTQANFGNGYFGTTAVSSAGTNASGLGIFEYDVPSGFTAICTKGLNL